ncbi:MAG: DNA-directed RNA polymerase subunit beta', partial [bacterium]
INYLTKLPTDLDLENEEDVKHVFGDPKQVEWALDKDAIGLHDPILYKEDGERHITTPGRVRFNQALADGIPFQNRKFNEDDVGELISEHIEDIGINKSVESLDNLKDLGYHESTLMGCSIGYEDLLTPERKEELLEQAESDVDDIKERYEQGEIVEEERYNRVINVWHEITQEVSDNVFTTMSKDMKGFNPVYMMADSGARGSEDQIRQLAGMRGLMAKPSGEVIELPIKSSFRDGLSVMEYFISTHGARKGLADTALKTADAGYLTRRLADVAQSVRIVEADCGTLNGMEVSPIRSSGDVLEDMNDRILGRVARRDIKHPQTGETIVEENQEIDEEKAQRIQECGFDSVEIRSLLTCEAEDGVCAKCYGRDLSSRQIVNIGEPVGIIAAQSIGEPGTQLTMRTFHTGGVASGGGEQGIQAQNNIYVESLPDNVVEYEEEDGSTSLVSLTDEGLIRLRKVKDSVDLDPDDDDVSVEPVAFEGLWVYAGDTIASKTVDGEDEEITADSEGIVHMDEDDDVLRVLGNEYDVSIGLGAKVLVDEGDIVESGDVYVEIDPYNELIIAEFDGEVSLRDIEVGRTVSEQVDETTGLINKVITEDKQGEMYPSLVLKRDGKQATRRYDLPYGSILVSEDGEEVQAGEVLAKMPKGDVQTKDITGGLPRVEDLFEARKRTKESAKIAEISGRVEFIKQEKRKEKGIRTIRITNPDTENSKKYRVKPGIHLKVRDGEMIEEGTPLTEGYVNPHDLLRIKGINSLQNYLVQEIQKVYLQQGIRINDKHIEVIVRQMLRRVMITDAGDTQFLPGERADRYRLARINEQIQADGGQPATFTPILQGITKASLETDSFISAASFQDTKRVLSNASCQGKVDELKGLKENVITGHLIPAGTGFEAYREMFNEDLRDVVEKARSFTRDEEAEETEEQEEVSAGS